MLRPGFDPSWLEMRLLAYSSTLTMRTAREASSISKKTESGLRARPMCAYIRLPSAVIQPKWVFICFVWSWLADQENGFAAICLSPLIVSMLLACLARLRTSRGTCVLFLDIVTLHFRQDCDLSAGDNALRGLKRCGATGAARRRGFARAAATW